ncbi:MAG: response regulator [Rhodospirillales bacterium]|jgi:two-component system chemotaxis response regulator CheY
MTMVSLRADKIPEFAKLRVLIVDDNEYILNLVKMVITDLGVADSFFARDAIEAMKVLESSANVNFVICDWNMPGLTGLEFLRKLRSDGNKIPFVMLTARADEGSVVQAKEIGVDAYLVKPFAPIQLEKKLRAIVGEMQPATTPPAKK